MSEKRDILPLPMTDTAANRGRRVRLPLSAQIVIGMVAGGLAGLLLGVEEADRHD